MKYLAERFNTRIDEASLRRDSTVLRRLLVDGELQRGWRAAGLERDPNLLAADLAESLVGFDQSKVAFASAGGAEYEGQQLAGMLFASQVVPWNQRKRTSGGPFREFKLREFIASNAVVAQGRAISRVYLSSMLPTSWAATITIRNEATVKKIHRSAVWIGWATRRGQA